MCVGQKVGYGFDGVGEQLGFGTAESKDDLTIRIDWVRVGDDEMISAILAPYDGQPLRPPTKEAPKAEYLQRRRALVAHKK